MSLWVGRIEMIGRGIKACYQMFAPHQVAEESNDVGVRFAIAVSVVNEVHRPSRTPRVAHYPKNCLLVQLAFLFPIQLQSCNEQKRESISPPFPVFDSHDCRNSYRRGPPRPPPGPPRPPRPPPGPPRPPRPPPPP